MATAAHAMERVRRGLLSSGTIPYGYRLNARGRVVVSKPEARVVVEIFEMFDAGVGKKTIARILNENGIPAPRVARHHGSCATKWWDSAIRGIIKRRRVYEGRSLVYNGALIELDPGFEPILKAPS